MKAAMANDVVSMIEVDRAYLEQLERIADRYQWLRERAVRIQGSDVWYSGEALDIRVDIGCAHVSEQFNTRLPDPHPVKRG